jgi:iron complex outermembrane receptor protein
MKYLYSIPFFIALLFTNLTLSAQLASGTAGGSIRGKVKTNDGQPAASVTVQLVENGKKTITNESGVFVFSNLKSGEYTIKTSSVGLQVQTQKVTVIDGEAITADFTLTESGSQLNEIVISTYKSPNNKTITTGKIAIPAKDLPQAVQIIGSQIIADQQANRLSDVLKNVNGVAYGENRGGVSGETFFARGYSLGGNNVFKNGARTSTGGMPETSTLESVEVLKGSAALLYGGVSGGAVVNMVTKKPKFENGGEVSFRTGSYDLYKPSLDLYGPITQKLAFRAIGTYEKAASYRNSVNADRIYVNPSLLYKISEKTDILLQGDYLKSDYTPDFGIGTVENKIVNIGRSAYVNAPWAYNNTNTVSSQLGVNHQFNDNWKIAVLGSLQAYNRNYFSAERPFALTSSGVAARNVTRSKTQEYTYNQQINLNGEFNTAGINHKLLVGADADQSNTTSNGFNYGPEGKATLNYGDVNLLDPTTFRGSGIEPIANNITRTKAPLYRMGVFVQDLVSLTSQFKVLAGIRYTYQKTPRTSVNNLVTNVTAPGTAVGKSEKAFSPKLALIYQPLKATSLYVSYANNLIANTGLDIYGSTLDPSIVDQYEAGIKNDFLDGKLSANVTAYSIKNNNFAQQALVKADGTGNGDTNVKELNGKTLSNGVEFDLTGTIFPGLNFIAGYSYNFIRYTETRDKTVITYDAPTVANPNAKAIVTVGGTVEGQRLVGTTKNTANGSLFYTLQDGKLRGLKVGASAYYTGNRNGGYNDTKTQTASRLIPLSDFTTFDLSAGYSWKKLSLLAKISNLTNELNYFAHENYSINPIAPRQFITTLGYRF